VSNRTRRKFAAFLVRKPDGTVGFEFEPRTRPPRAARGGAKETASNEPVPAPRRQVPRAPSTAHGVPAATRSATKQAARPAPAVVAKKAAKRTAKTAKSSKTARR
jgi:DNA topoisomerase-3